MGGRPTHIKPGERGAIVGIEWDGAHQIQLIHGHRTLEDVL